ncbi:hypothetical protein [Dichotomicrobium thermohalophilum]|uniref:Uncharacterized protein n=1 Tax=Dichotomicrobium thermohalophilum TaxID=933063 RepID=A0A397QC49_9HYPH|nr:hypothetical protein [Dichotomicrobium thermohalophilum]RIA55674.1 hypothetical protein BXY53_0744 [Dichotomicrobium thermohalophilum]
MNWRDVTTRHARETLAERICARFFTRDGAASSDAPETDFATAGQRLQALSGERDIGPLGQQNLAAILDASAPKAGTLAAKEDENGEAPAHAGLTAKAA